MFDYIIFIMAEIFAVEIFAVEDFVLKKFFTVWKVYCTNVSSLGVLPEQKFRQYFETRVLLRYILQL